MKTGWRVVIVAAALVMISVGAHASFAQKKKKKPAAGGYAQIPAYNQEVVSAARFAAREQRDMIFVDSIQSAEVQVVAGRNYRISMRVWDAANLKDVTTVVHKSLKGEYTLKSWQLSGSPPVDATGMPALYANSPLEQLMKAVGEAYKAKALDRLDARRPYLNKVRIVIVNSITDEEKGRSFRTLAQAERWLKRREHDGLPFRAIRPLYGCEGGKCEFDFNGGIDHNHLYLQSVKYGWRAGRPYIKTIYLLDG